LYACYIQDGNPFFLLLQSAGLFLLLNVSVPIFHIHSTPSIVPSSVAASLPSSKNRRIDPVLPTMCFPDRKWDRRVALVTILTAARHICTQNMTHDEGNNAAIEQVVARFVVNAVDVQPVLPKRCQKPMKKPEASSSSSSSLFSYP
jgi:hypothetical protein